LLPAQAHHFAKALLNRSKSDAIDAQVLATLAAKLQPQPWKPASQTYEQLYQRLVQRDSVLEMLQMERNRLHALRLRPTVVAEVQARIQEHIAFLQSQLDVLDEEIKEALSQDDAWHEAAGLLRSIKGFGPIATAWLLTATHNFTACQRPEQIASYAGLVPRLFESGSSVHKPPAIGYAPHPRLRQALYMATLSAVQYNPAIRAFYHRLLDNGKPKKVALCACARKLVHIAWAVVNKQQLWQPDFVSHQPLEALVLA
jgi:transposase